MKKGLSIVLCSVLAMTAMTGCGSKAKSSESGTKKITNIIWQYPSPGNLGSGFNDMEDALNVMMERDIGVHVKFEPVGLMDSQKKASLMVSAGQQLDISLTAFTSVGPLVENGLVNPLDDLIAKYGKDIKAKCGTELAGCSYNSKIYGVPPAEGVGKGYGYLAKTRLLKKYGITIDNNKKYTANEMGKIFAKVKAGEGKNFYCTIPWNTTQDPLNSSYMEYDKISGSLNSGVLMLNRSFKNTTVTNLFATDEYADYAKKMYDWSNKGYISPDAAVSNDSPDTLMRSKSYLGMFYWAYPTSALEYAPIAGEDLTLIHMVDPYVASDGGKQVMWNIPTTSVNPEKAMQALNYIYKNKAAAKLIQFGLEGKSYKVVQKSNKGELIKYLSDDTSKLPYYNPYALWGDILEWPAVSPSPINKNQLKEEFSAKIPKSRYSPIIGYSFAQKNVSSEIAAVTTVINQYTPSINSGALDPSKALPQFLKALKAAGIDKIIKENQTQLDKWLQNKK